MNLHKKQHLFIQIFMNSQKMIYEIMQSLPYSNDFVHFCSFNLPGKPFVYLIFSYFLNLTLMLLPIHYLKILTARFVIQLLFLIAFHLFQHQFRNQKFFLNLSIELIHYNQHLMIPIEIHLKRMSLIINTYCLFELCPITFLKNSH